MSVWMGWNILAGHQTTYHRGGISNEDELACFASCVIANSLLARSFSASSRRPGPVSVLIHSLAAVVNMH